MGRIRSDNGIRVTGLNELNRALREISKDAQKELTKANKNIAEFVAQDAQAAAYSLGGVAAKVAPTIKAAGGTTWAGVGFGSGQPYAGGAAWGSDKYKQFKPWRGREGYFPYAQIGDNNDRIEQEHSEAVDRLLRQNGLA